MRAISIVASGILASACNSSSPASSGGTPNPDSGTISSPDASADGPSSGSDAAEAITLDRHAIVFAAALDGQATTDLYVLNGTTTTRLTVTAGAELYPTISSNRKHISFVRDFQLFAIDADGRNERLVAPSTGRERKSNDIVYSTTNGPAAWSPDDTKLAYLYPQEPHIVNEDGYSIDESSATTIHIINADGTNDRLVTPVVPTVNSLAWGPSDTLTFSEADDCPDCAGGQWYAAVQADGSNLREVRYPLPTGESNPLKHLDWSPDGTKWVFVDNAGYFNYDEPGMVYTSSAFMGNQHVIVAAPSWNPRWSPDGTEIAYIGTDGIYILPAAGGTARRVLAATGLRGLDW
jgi:Tol biopolymer transport system component